MKRFPILILVLITAALTAAVTTACEVSTASLSDVKLCDNANSEGACSTDMSTFDYDTEKIYLSATLENAPDDTKITAIWKYLGGEEGIDPQELDSMTISTTESGTMPYYSSMPAGAKGWYEGEYEVVVDLGTDNSDPVSKKFTIKAPATRVTDIRMCDKPASSGECSSGKTTFSMTTAEIFLSSMLENVQTGTNVTATWNYLGGEEGIDPQEIDSITVTANESGDVPFYTSMPAGTSGWPKGDYEVIIELDAKDSKPYSKKFSVR